MSANVGGYIRGPWWRYVGSDDETTRRCFVVAWGNIVREPLERYQETSVTRFVIKTGRGAGRKEKHLACVSYGERLANVISKALERGDVVFCCGTWNEITRPNRNKKIVPVYEAVINILIPMGLIGFLLDLYSLPELHKLISDRNNDDADVWESD